MKIPKLLILIFLVVFLFRLYFSFQTTYLSDDTSYLNLRNMDYVKDNLKPMTYDDLSYGGKQTLASPIFPYFLWMFSLVPFGLKIFPQLIISLIVFIAFFISKMIVNDDKSALFASLLAGFVPLIFNETINKISIYSIAIPLIFFMIYSFLRINENRYKIFFIISSLIICLLDPIFIFLILVFVFYLLLTYTEDIKIRGIEIKSIIIFSIFFIIVNIIILKNAISLYGLDIIYKNIPKSLLLGTFKKIDILALIYHFGYIPLIFGGISAYYGFIKEKSKSIYILSSLAFISLCLVFLNVLGFYAGLMMIGISAAILSSLAINRLYLYLNMTKLSKYNNLFVPMLFLLIFILSIYPSYNVSDRIIADAPISAEINSLLWIKNDSLATDTVLGTIYEGNLISYFTDRKNVFDTSFMFAPDSTQRLVDASIIFTSDYERASSLIKNYNIKYLFLSDKTKSVYGIKDLKYADSKCVEQHEFVYKIVC
ncbi:MAG: hypothetical protein KKD48_03275 [Nanoarchaeota archaeon]|nr:hypothetical protein [Nanoarchaeota archaeon]